MGHRKVIGIITAVMLLVCLAAVPVMAQPLPCSFAGTVTLDGAPCPGSTVEARVDATVVGTTEVTAESEYYVVIAQDFVTGVPAEGDTLNFYVDGNLGGTDTWNAGGIKTLDLAAVTTGEDNPDVAEGLASLGDKLIVAYGYKAGEGGWTWYNPSWPPGANTLTTLYRGRGYWINVTEACTLSYGTRTYSLDTGWNLIGWLGW